MESWIDGEDLDEGEEQEKEDVEELEGLEEPKIEPLSDVDESEDESEDEESPSPKTRKMTHEERVAFMLSPLPIPPAVETTLTLLRRENKRAMRTPPIQLAIDCPVKFILEHAAELERLETGVWFVMKNILTPKGTRIVVGMLLLLPDKQDSRDYLIHLVDEAESLFPRPFPWTGRQMHMLDDEETLALIRVLGPGVKGCVQDTRQTKDDVWVLLL